MRRLLAVGALVLLSACGAGGGPTATRTTAPADPPLAPALLTSSLLRRVPGLATATVTGLPQLSAFDDPNPRGPCGAALPRLALTDAIGSSWASDAIRGGAQLVLRRPAAELQGYMAARIRDAIPGCPVFAVENRGVTQEMKFEEAVSVSRNADQSLAIVTAVRVNGDVRAVTTIEIRTGNLLSRSVIFSARPLGTPTVRGVASLMANALEAFT